MENLNNSNYSPSSDIQILKVYSALEESKNHHWIHHHTDEKSTYDSFTIFLMKEGSNYLYLDEEEYISEAGDLSFTPAYTSYVTKSITEHHSFYGIYFDAKIPEQPENNFFHNRHTVKKAFHTKPLIEKICKTFMSKPAGYELQIKRDIYDLLWIIFDKCNESLTSQSNFYNIRAAVSYMDKNFTLKEINIDYLASLCKLTPTYFSRVFHQQFGVTPKIYIIKKRLELAKEYLSYSANSIIEIAEKVGYSDPAYFSTAFKRFYGYTPTEYRNRYRYED